MAKRFTDTNKYKKPFIRGLQGAYKVLWDYLYHDCDHAGIWIVDFEVAQIYIGQDLPVNKNDALKYFNNGEERILPFDNGKKWFIPSFIEFQYGELNPSNRAHKSVIDILTNKGLICTLQGHKDKEQDKDKVKDTLIGNRQKFIENVIEECKLLGYGENIWKPFCEFWTDIDATTKQMQWQTRESFAIQSRLKGWVKNEDKEKQINYDIK